MRYLLLLVPFFSTGQTCVTNSDCADGLYCTNNYCQNNICLFDPVICNDNIVCTADHCQEGQGTHNCYYEAIVGCTGHPCTTGHCKILVAFIDSCGCFWRSDVSNLNADSIIWTFYDHASHYVEVNTNDSVVCYDFPHPGQWSIYVTAHYGQAETNAVKRFVIKDCGCENNYDCNDNNICTLDDCYKGVCRNQRAYSSLSSISFNQWYAQCGCCH